MALYWQCWRRILSLRRVVLLGLWSCSLLVFAYFHTVGDLLVVAVNITALWTSVTCVFEQRLLISWFLRVVFWLSVTMTIVMQIYTFWTRELSLRCVYWEHQMRVFVPLWWKLVILLIRLWMLFPYPWVATCPPKYDFGKITWQYDTLFERDRIVTGRGEAPVRRKFWWWRAANMQWLLTQKVAPGRMSARTILCTLSIRLQKEGVWSYDLPAWIGEPACLIQASRIVFMLLANHRLMGELCQWGA